LFKFNAVKMLRKDVQVGDLMWRLWTQRPALRRVPIRIFKLAAMGLRIAVHNVIGAFGLHGVEGKNGRPDMNVYVFHFAMLDMHF
jgi:hypothetical protein